MCFDQKTSFGFAGFGLLSTFFIYWKTRNFTLATCVFFFFTMELLQGFQYFWIDQCDNVMNQFLTFLGLLHLSFQPYFCHLTVYSFLPRDDKVTRKQFEFLLRFIFVGSSFFIARFVFGYFGMLTFDDTSGFSPFYDEATGNKVGYDSQCGLSNEWIRGNTLCTFSGRRHLAWSIPLATPSYYLPSVFLHFYNMFVPFFIIRKYKMLWVYGVLLFLTGPVLASLFSDDYMEQGSIWCFFSMLQVTAVVAICYFLDRQMDPVVKEKTTKATGTRDFGFTDLTDRPQL